MQLSFQMLPKNDGSITIIYGQDDNVRHIRMNARPPGEGWCLRRWATPSVAGMATRW